MKNKFLVLFELVDEEVKNTALTHSSYANEYKIESNERLEFLGDSVLGLITSEYMYKYLDLNEGKMSKLRANMVCWQNLSKILKKMDIKDKLKLGNSLKTISDSMLADTIESMIGAIYLKHGLNKTRDAVLELLNVKEYLHSNPKAIDFKTELQEICQKLKMKVRYDITNYVTKGGQTNFRSKIYIDDVFYGYGTGSLKKEAEQNSAKIAISKLEKHNV